MVQIDTSRVGEAETRPSEPDQAEIRRQLASIQASADFDVPQRARKFLSYVVDETLAGRADRIKAYSIALEVFGRDASFDAQADPVVRIEAGRVRRALEHYYLTGGRTDPILITIPKGGYVPLFTPNPAYAEPSPPSPPDAVVPPAIAASLSPRFRRFGLLAGFGVALPVVWAIADWAGVPRLQPEALTSPGIPRLLIEPFEDLTDSDGSSIIARGLGAEIIGQIARFKDLIVINGAHMTDAAWSDDTAGNTLARYILDGSVRISGDAIRLTTSLRNSDDGSILWAQSFDADLKVQELLTVETEIAQEVTTALAQPYGVIFQEDSAHVTQTPPEDWEAYTCTLAYYTYRTDLNPEIHAFVQDCLERTIREYPTFATAWALLSITYLDEFRFQYLLRPAEEPPLGLALDHARRAIKIDPRNVRGQQAYMMALALNGEIDAALKVGEQALSINPNDTDLRAEYGVRLALSGRWREGSDLILDARLRNPGPQGYYEANLALAAYMQRDHQAAALWIRKADVQANPLFHFIAAAIYGQLGDISGSRRERDWITANADRLLQNVHHEVALRIFRPEDRAFFIEGLRLAGLPIPEA